MVNNMKLKNKEYVIARAEDGKLALRRRENVKAKDIVHPKQKKYLENKPAGENKEGEKKYTKKELESLDWKGLKEVGSKLGVKFRGKEEGITEILEAQK